jgi:arylsulfatase A-like enzyme
MRLAATLWIAALAAGCGRSDGAATAARAVGWAEGEAPPSVLLVSIDTLRPDHLGLYGYERDTSPYLDRLAAECLVFDRAYTTAAWTLVAHMSMLTGLEPEEHGVTEPTRALSPEVPPVAERLREVGYRTLGFPAGVCIWVAPKFGFGRGFDLYEAHDGPPDLRERIDRELDQLADDRPVFVFAHVFDVHTAMFTPGFTGFYDPPAPHDTAFLPDARARLADVNCKQVWDDMGTLPPDQLEALIALYDGGIRYVDSELEHLIEGWRERGLLDRSILIITADHGEGLGDHGRVGGHGGMYEEGLRIPLLVRFPDGHRAGERESGLASVIDYAPTILETAGLEVEPWRSGTSLRRAAGEGGGASEAGEAGEASEGRVVRATHALVSDRWKLVKAAPEDQLYDLAEDQHELEPLSAKEEGLQAQAQALRQRYQSERVRRERAPGTAIDLDALDPEELESLRKLGYAGVVDGDG